ncbi:MAG: hypothetical protein A2Z18_02640 [Armatimonadetes bacterium RBG_16_58_9]|nr:MAG: hypothetical protein A2Z18_02640 [Armatimonadetes bacterium RBG_16_58_9]
MKANSNHRSTARPASALLIFALCVLIGAASAAYAKSYWPSRKSDDKKQSTTVQKTTRDSGKTQSVPTSSKPDSRSSIWGNRNSQVRTETRAASRPDPNYTSVSASRSTSYRANNTGTATTVYRAENAVRYTPRPMKTDAEKDAFWGRNRSRATYQARPEVDSRARTTTEVSTSSSYHPDGKSDSRTRVVQDREKPDRRPDSNRPTIDTRVPAISKSYRPSGSAVNYKSATKTTYRSRVNNYYHPSTVYADTHSRSVRAYHPPKSYRPPDYRDGRYYYPTHYRGRPCHYGYWSFAFYPDFTRRSMYFYYGYFPYIQVTRVYESAYPEVIYIERPIYISGGYYLESQKYTALDDALADIRGAWVAGRYDLVEQHVMRDDKVAVFLDGQYDYSIDGDDYLSMTRDAIEDMETISFVWDKVKGRADGTVTAFGTHRYHDTTGAARTVYVSYTLDTVGGRYYIVEVGSSVDPLR